MNLRVWLRNIRMNFASEQAYIAHRMLQEQDGWQLHLSNSKNYILDFARNRSAKTIRFLGSGWLLDIPIDEIIDKYDKIILTDIYHPKQIVNKYAKHPNVEFETIDLTFGAVDITYAINRRNFNFNKYLLKIKALQSQKYVEDIVVSVNLLSQLSIFLTDYLSRKVKIGHSQFLEIASAIQANHINNLPKEKSILITDYEEEILDEDDLFIGTKPTTFINITKNQFTKEWTWQFDSLMTFHENCKTNFKVIATKI